MGGPRWLGIGAQRSGTTWFTDLLLQHPEVKLARNGRRKELHFLYRDDVKVKRYRRMFDGCAGEWTPAYLRNLTVPPVAAQALDEDALVLVMLRDPVERFASAMRHYYSRAASGSPGTNVRLFSDVTWGGMFASQLDEWAQHVGSKRMLVFQYEAVRTDPQHYIDQVWRRLGLTPVALEGVERPSRTASTIEWHFPDGLQTSLQRLYAPEVDRLERWDIDPTLWPWFADSDAAKSRKRTPLAVLAGLRR